MTRYPWYILAESSRTFVVVGKMVYVDPEFVVPTIPEDEMYEGTEVDENVRSGRLYCFHWVLFLTPSSAPIRRSYTVGRDARC